jgi:para-aminobenzoate synthetase / 4-amino-4-deoxychorismate lyase
VSFPSSPAPFSVIVREPSKNAWLRFTSPIDIVEAYSLESVPECLERAARKVEEQNLFAAGFIAYEAAPAFDRALTTRPPVNGLPLLWFGLYEHAEQVNIPLPDAGFEPLDWVPSVDRTEYDHAIVEVKERIASGDTYQVNYTMRLATAFHGEPWNLFCALNSEEPAGYAAYLDIGRFALCSASPELFFTLNNDCLACRPMKGTARRGRTGAEDKDRQAWLAASAKNRAENVMIVDMVRNDLGRVAVPGSVAVERLFDVERHPTVWQMTSSVTARTSAGVPAIMAALFPCASVTGAPKVKTMEIIAGLETSPRGVYTGAIGYLAPGRAARFSVAIRTVCVDREHATAVYGVGGGILHESDTAEEYEECMIKTRILTVSRPAFMLMESLLWTRKDGYSLLENHVKRLSESAGYFGFSFDRRKILGRLNEAAAAFGDVRLKVRLTLGRDGTITVETLEISEPDEAVFVRLGLAATPVDSSDVFLFHKTTNRTVYDEARKTAFASDDIVLWNERGEVTETTVCNIVAEIDGRMVTPPVLCGLLAGTFRQDLLDNGKIFEEIISKETLGRASRIWVVNSVRGMRPARYLPAL